MPSCYANSNIPLEIFQDFFLSPRPYAWDEPMLNFFGGFGCHSYASPLCHSSGQFSKIFAIFQTLCVDESKPKFLDALDAASPLATSTCLAMPGTDAEPLIQHFVRYSRN
jgi:hypothetical protein